MYVTFSVLSVTNIKSMQKLQKRVDGLGEMKHKLNPNVTNVHFAFTSHTNILLAVCFSAIKSNYVLFRFCNRPISGDVSESICYTPKIQLVTENALIHVCSRCRADEQLRIITNLLSTKQLRTQCCNYRIEYTLSILSACRNAIIISERV